MDDKNPFDLEVEQNPFDVEVDTAKKKVLTTSSRPSDFASGVSAGFRVGESVSGEIPTVTLDKKEAEQGLQPETDAGLQTFIDTQKANTGRLYQENPFEFKKPIASQERVQDNLKQIFSSDNPIWQNPKAREKLYTNLSKHGYDANQLYESGERFVTAKEKLPQLAEAASTTNDPALQYEYATALGDIGDHANAFSIYTEMIKQGNPSADVYKGMAYNLHKMGNEEEAQKALLAAQMEEQQITGSVPEYAKNTMYVQGGSSPQEDYLQDVQAGRMKDVAGAIEQHTPALTQAKGIVEGITHTFEGIKKAKDIFIRPSEDIVEDLGAGALKTAASLAGGAISYLMNTTPVGLAITYGAEGATETLKTKLPEDGAVTAEEATGFLMMPISTGFAMYERKSKDVVDDRLKDAGMLVDAVLGGVILHATAKPFVKGKTVEQVKQAGETATKILKQQRVDVRELKNLHEFIYENKSFRQSFMNPNVDIQKQLAINKKAKQVADLEDALDRVKTPAMVTILEREHQKESETLNNLINEQHESEIKVSEAQTKNELIDDTVNEIKSEKEILTPEQQKLAEENIKIIETEKQDVPFTKEWSGEELKPKIEPVSEVPLKEKSEFTDEEIQQAYSERENELKESPDHKNQIIHEHLGRIRREDFEHYGDPKLLDKENISRMNLLHFSDKAESLDVKAKELSDIAGVEITPQDVINYIAERERNPEKFKQAEKPTDDKVKKTILTHRAYEGEIRESVKKYLENKGLTRKRFSREERSRQAELFIDEFGDDAAIDAVKNFDVRGAMATSILAKLIKKLDTEMSKDGITPEQLDVLSKKQADLIELAEREGYFGGEFAGQLAYEYIESDIGYNAVKKAQEWKEQFGTEVPEEVRKEWEKRDEDIRNLKKQLAEMEERAKKAEEEQAVENVKEDVGREKKRRPSVRKSVLSDEKLSRKTELRKKYAPIFNDITNIPKLFAEKDFREYVSLVFEESVGDFKEFSRQAIKELGKKIRPYLPQLFKDAGGEFKEGDLATTEGKIKVPKSLIRDLVENGADNITDLTKQVKDILKEEYPDATDREIRDAITEYGKTLNLSKADIDVQIRRMKRIGRIVSGLEDIQNKKRPLKSGLQRDKLDAEERALQKELREAMKELPLDEATKERELKTATDAAKSKLKNQIEDLEREIEKGEKVPRSTRTIKDDAELKDLREKRDKLKEEHDKIFKDEEFQDKKRLESAKKRASQKIEDLERRLREKDFSKKEKKPIIADTELTKTQAEILRLQSEYDKEFYKNKLLNRTKVEKVKDNLWHVWGLTRLLRATGEASFVGIQGLTLTIRALVRNPKVLKEAFGHSISSFGSERRTEQFLNNIKSQDYYPEMKKTKLQLTEPHAEITARDELFLSDYANMIWNTVGAPLKLINKKAYEAFKAASPFKAFERAAVGYLDTLRVARWLEGKDMLNRQGITFDKNPEAFKDMADVVNTLTGRGSLGWGEQHAEKLTKIFFSPRLWSSAIKTATPYAFYHFGKMTAGKAPLRIMGKETPIKVSVAQKMAIADLATQIALTTSMVMLAKAYFDNDDREDTGVEMNPTSSDFMKIKIGDTRVDPWGGKIQQVILLSRILAGSIKKQSGEKQKLGQPFKTPTRFELLTEMATNKLSPSAKIFEDYLNSHEKPDGETVDKYGHPYALSDEVLNNLYPIYWETISELEEDGYNVTDGLLTFYAFFGGGVNTYSQKEKVEQEMQEREEEKTKVEKKETPEEKLKKAKDKHDKERKIKQDAEKYGVKYIEPKTPLKKPASETHKTE